MNHIIFKRVAILSLSEQKAFAFDFSEGLNFIHGTNDTGKSSLIKSLYFCLGGDSRLDESWKQHEIITKLSLAYQGKIIDVIRKSSYFVISVSEGEIIKSEKIFKKTSELAGEIQRLFGFNLLLTLRQNKETILANPASYYFPFYIDQDDGWSNVLDTFKSLKMYVDWQKNGLQYHAGIKPKEYYALNGERKILSLKISEYEQEADLIRRTKFRFEKLLGNVNFDIDVNFYINKIDGFLKQCEELEQEERVYRLKALNLYSRRNLVSDLIFDIENERMNFSSDKIAEDDLTFALNNYDINVSKSNLFGQKSRLYDEKIKLDEEILSIRNKLLECNKLTNEIKSMLSDVNNNFSIKDVINAEAYKTASLAFDNQLAEIQEKIEKISFMKDDVDLKIKEFNNPKRTKEINGYFLDVLNKVQSKLQLPISEKGSVLNYRALTAGKTGSRAPRAIFAYHYALLMTIKRFSTLPILPIVIDSPKQQDLDDELSEKLIQLCLDDLAAVSQVIIGAVKPEKNMIGYHSINLSKKFSLLNSEKFNEVYQEIMPKFNAMLTTLD